MSFQIQNTTAERNPVARPRQSNRPSQALPIEKFLAEIANVDVRDGFVAPRHDVGQRLEMEIQRRSECVPASLFAEYRQNTASAGEPEFISANPATFVRESIAVSERIAAELRHLGATHFELAFRNIPNKPNERGDLIVVRTRYILAAPKCANCFGSGVMYRTLASFSGTATLPCDCCRGTGRIQPT